MGNGGFQNHFFENPTFFVRFETKKNEKNGQKIAIFSRLRRWLQPIFLICGRRRFFDIQSTDFTLKRLWWASQNTTWSLSVFLVEILLFCAAGEIFRYSKFWPVLADGVSNSVTKNFFVPFARLALRASSAHCVLFSALRAFWSAF